MMPKVAPNFTERIFVEAGREISKGKLTLGQLEVIVSQLSNEERPRFHQLFSDLAEGTKTESTVGTNTDTESDTEQKPLGLTLALQAQLEQAEKLFEKDFMGPRQFEKAHGFMPERIPAIPFSEERLRQAKKMGLMLVLHVDKTPEGKPMTMRNMNSGQAESGRNARVLYNADWYKNEDFYTQDVPRLSWRLESKTVLPDSTDKNEVEQLELIVLALQNTVFKGMAMPGDYQEAIEEFESKKRQITVFMEGDNKWEKASEIIEGLKLSKMTRGIPAEVAQTIETYHQNTSEYLFPNVLVRTPRRPSLGNLVRVGNAGSDGMYVGGSHPGIRVGSLGVALSLQS